MRLTLDVLKNIIKAIASTHDEELGCDECFEQLDQFAELKLQGKNASEALPLVQHHLNRCGTCKEEFEAFMAALRATEKLPRQSLDEH